MPPSTTFSRSSLLKIAPWVGIFLAGFQLSAMKSLFHPRDLLPHMPKKVSMPILNYLHSPVELLPAFVGVANSSTVNTSNWKGACFNKNKAWIVFHNKTGSQFGGGTLHIEVRDAHSCTCLDLYVFATPFRITWDYYYRGGEHTFDFKEWEGKDEYEYVKNHGLSIFIMKDGMKGTLKELWETLSLLLNNECGEKSNIEFMKKQMEGTFEIRPKPWVTSFNVDDIQTGDFLAISKIRSGWGAFETLEKWVTGAFAGHTAVCLRDSDGKLWVGESGHDNAEGQTIIDVLPWDEWWDSEVKNDEYDCHIAVLPLHPDIRDKFDNSAAWEYALSMKGHPYGYRNFIFSWIDTISGNYPPPLDSNALAAFMTIMSEFQIEYATKFFIEALNKRLGTKGLDLPKILVEVEKRGSSFGELLAIPEQDDWIYSDGKSTTCVAFALSVYKAAGLFGPITSSIQATEFTIKDAYSLNFFENNMSRLPKWCNDGDTVKLPYCQIKGKYRMELPGYNTMNPYAHMNEKCPSLPPKYTRPPNC